MIEPTKVSFDSGGITCIGYLYHPTQISATRPCVVLGTGFTGTQDTPSIQAAAERFAANGFVALTFDYQNFGESDGTPRQLIRIKSQQQDFYAAIRFARSQAGIDPERIALWGTSLGGGHVIAVAADDPQIAAVITRIPFNGFPKQVEGRSSTATLRLLGAMVKDTIHSWLELPPHYIPAVGTSGELAVMATPQAQQSIAAMHSVQGRNEVAPRVLFEMMRYKPSDEVDRLQMPVLVCIAEFDREVPADLARQIAEKAPRGELKCYPFAHFDFYRLDIRTQVLDD